MNHSVFIFISSANLSNESSLIINLINSICLYWYEILCFDGSKAIDLTNSYVRLPVKLACDRSKWMWEKNGRSRAKKLNDRKGDIFLSRLSPTEEFGKLVVAMLAGHRSTQDTTPWRAVQGLPWWSYGEGIRPLSPSPGEDNAACLPGCLSTDVATNCRDIRSLGNKANVHAGTEVYERPGFRDARLRGDNLLDTSPFVSGTEHSLLLLLSTESLHVHKQRRTWMDCRRVLTSGFNLEITVNISLVCLENWPSRYTIFQEWDFGLY